MADITGIWHFTDDEYAQVAIEAIIEAFGEEFVAPMAAQFQPIDASIFNASSLLQFDLPASVMNPMAELSQSESIASSINSLMSMLSPLMSAYGMITTVIEVIVAIIEVLCALMNPFAVKRAIKKLIKIAIPKLIKLFPYIAGIAMVISIIKMVLAIIIFIITVVIPMLLLLLANAIVVNDALKALTAGAGLEDDKVKAGKEKIQALITELINQMGVLKAFLPLFEMIMMILGLNIAFPCKKDCCDTDVCPEILKNPPKGRAFLWPTTFGESEPYFAFKVTTSDLSVLELEKYNQSSEQLNQQLSESINACCPAGTELADCPNFTVKITNNRGQVSEISVPIVKISQVGSSRSPSAEIVVVSADLKRFIGYVNFEIVPNFDILFARGVISLGCHPEIAAARAETEALYPKLNTPIDLYPIPTQMQAVADGLDKYAGELKGLDAPYDTNRISAIQAGMVALLTDFADSLKRKLRSLVDTYTNINNSTIEVNKNVVRANMVDLAVVSVIPRDDAGHALLKNLPDDTIPSVEIYSTIGSLSNKRFDKSVGAVLMDLKSPLTGLAEITAKINSDFIADKINGVQVIRKVSVRFVADSALPARRIVPAIVEKEPKRG